MTLQGAKFDGLDPQRSTIDPAIAERVSAANGDSVINTELPTISKAEVVAELGNPGSDALMKQLETSYKERKSLILNEQDLFADTNEISDQVIQKDTDERQAPPRLEAVSEVMADLESHEAVGLKPAAYEPLGNSEKTNQQINDV